MPLEPENYLLMDARRKEEKIKGNPWKGESRKNGNYLIRAPDICLPFFCHPYTSNSASVFSPKCEKFIHYTVCRSSDWVNRGDMVGDMEELELGGFGACPGLKWRPCVPFK